ncbi:MAG: cysteine-rich CWC family protein [Burkholderiales bacterium]|nr:MAG: cysteine-rich CWC family protein [Burkholderiales bacterium]
MENDATEPIDTRRCPICGADNDCALASSSDRETECWCTTVEIGEQVLRRVPERLRGLACVCRRCATES